MSLAPLELEDLLSLVEDLAQEHSALDAGVVIGSPRWNWPRLHQPNFDTSWLNVVGYADWMPLSDYADECGGVAAILHEKRVEIRKRHFLKTSNAAFIQKQSQQNKNAAVPVAGRDGQPLMGLTEINVAIQQ